MALTPQCCQEGAGAAPGSAGYPGTAGQSDPAPARLLINQVCLLLRWGQRQGHHGNNEHF